MSKVMIFIDGSNLLRTCNEYYSDLKIDMLKLRDMLTENRDLVRVYYYGSIPTLETGGTKEQIDKEMGFYRFLEHHGFKVTKLPLRKRGDRIMEKGIDVSLVTDMLSLAFHRAYDIAVLVSGDEDYKKTIEEIKHIGIRVELAFFKNGMAKAYYRNGDNRPDKIVYLDDLIQKIKK